MWKEIDLDKRIWRIPAERMKMKDAHIVPLSKQSIELFTSFLLLINMKNKACAEMKVR